MALAVASALVLGGCGNDDSAAEPTASGSLHAPAPTSTLGPVDLVEGEVPVGGDPIGTAAAAALLSLLGVSDEDVMREYLLTNDELVP